MSRLKVASGRIALILISQVGNGVLLPFLPAFTGTASGAKRSQAEQASRWWL